MELRKITLGNKYEFLIRKEDRVDVLYSSLTGFTFLFFLNRPLLQEIREFSKNIKVHIAMIDDMTHFLFEIGDMPIMDCSFHIKMQEGMDIPVDFKPIPEKEGYACQIILADARNGMVVHLRYFSTSHEFAEFIRSEMIKQNSAEFNRKEYVRKVERLAKKYPTPAMILPLSTISFSHKRL